MKPQRLNFPAVIAHRGASLYAPENTIAAFNLAVEQGADAIELDVMLTSDKQPVVIHNARVDTTTNGTGLVSQLTLAEIKTLDAGSYFSDEYAGETIPTLGEVFEAVGRKLSINIELKNLAAPFDDLPEIVSKTIKDHGVEDKVFISSFNPIALRKFNQIMPEVPVGLLVTSGLLGNILKILGMILVRYQSINPDFRTLSQKIVDGIHARNLKVFTYTVNTKEEMEKMLHMGVDAIFTDNPILGISIFRGKV